MSTSPLDYQRLYLLDDPMATRPLRLELDDKGLRGQFDFDALARGRLRLETPLKLRGFMGGQPADFLWTGLVVVVCVSARVVELFRQEEIIGWDTYPVEVYDRKGVYLPGYHGLAITGPTCRRDRSRSQIITKPAPAPGGRAYDVYKGLYFDESQWDGSNIFKVERFGGVVVTERVQRLLKRNKITNVRLIPLTEVERDVSFDAFDKP